MANTINLSMVDRVTNDKIKLMILFLVHLQFWGCSYLQTITYPNPILIEDNEHVYIRYQFNEIRIIGSVDAGNYNPQAYIFAVFHRADLDAPIIQKMFLPGDTLEFMVAENHLNAAPNGNVAVLKAIGDDFQQEEISFSYDDKGVIILPQFILHKVPYYYENQFIQLSGEFTDSSRTDSGGVGLSGFVEGLHLAKTPKRGEERNTSSAIDSGNMTAIPQLKNMKAFIFSSPDEAELYIDGQLRGETPIGILNLSIGDHSFKLLKEGYAPLEKILDIQPAKKVNIEFRLNRLNVLHFTTKEERLKFVLDDEHEWWDKSIKLNVESGNHVLKVYKRGKIVDEQDLIIDWNEKLEYFLPVTVAAVTDST